MRAIRAGLDRNLNKENINFSTITDRVQAGEWCYQCLPGRDRSRRQNLVHETKTSHDTPRCRNSLRREALILLSSNKFNESSAMVSDFLAGSIQCQVSKESALMEIRQNNRWRRIRLQVQLRFLHRSFSAGKLHNCIFNIKYCSNWTLDKGTERQSSGCFVESEGDTLQFFAFNDL